MRYDTSRFAKVTTFLKNELPEGRLLVVQRTAVAERTPFFAPSEGSSLRDGFLPVRGGRKPS